WQVGDVIILPIATTHNFYPAPMQGKIDILRLDDLARADIIKGPDAWPGIIILILVNDKRQLTGVKPHHRADGIDADALDKLIKQRLVKLSFHATHDSQRGIGVRAWPMRAV